MITNIFLNVIALSISTSLIIIFLLIFAPFLNKRYAIKWKYLIWVVIAVRLIIPFHIDISFPQIVIDIPTEITVPIDINNENDTSTMLLLPIVSNRHVIMAPSQTERKPLKFTLLDITAYLWLMGCLLFLSVHIFSFLYYKGQIAKKGMVVEERNILQQVCKLSRKLRIKTNIKILRYKNAESPMVIGFLKPMLVLSNCDYSEEELFFILEHELIHIKRHDSYFKLLFVIANALHWFNPLIYIMQKEAVVDMELSCDEKVIQQTAYAVRKAYTETLFSTFNKRYKRETFLTTQFYGGKKIMKKRFKNILTKSPKKNGLLLCICVICITLSSGMLIGCSAIKNVRYMNIGYIFKPYGQAEEISFQMPEDWKGTMWDIMEESPDWGYSIEVCGRDDASIRISGQYGNIATNFGKYYSNEPKSFQTSQGMMGQYVWDEHMSDDGNPVIDVSVLFDTELLGGFYSVSFDMPKSVYNENKDIIDKVFQSIVIKEAQ